MYAYSEFDRQFLRSRAAQYRDQLERHLRGELSADDFRPLRLQNGWYIQRYAPMLRVAVPYGELNAQQLRVLARVAREFDQPEPEVYQRACAAQAALGTPVLPVGVGHFTTRQNVQFNWIPLARSADVMDLLASADLHGIQTSGNCIRNITSDALAGIAPDEAVDPRPYCELLRQWSTLHPEFAALPRKFKIAVIGAREDRAAMAWHDVGLRLQRRADGAVGFAVYAGGGMGRTPMVAPLVADFVPWAQILIYLEALVRTYNRFGRRDNLYKARIKILVKAEGQAFVDAVNAEFAALRAAGAPEVAPETLARFEAYFQPPSQVQTAWAATDLENAEPTGDEALAYQRWLARNVHAHRDPALRAVTLSFKRIGQAPGDARADQLDAAADLAERFSAGEVRVTHQQNLLLPWVPVRALPALWRAARALKLAQPSIGLLTDVIACPGGDFCALANARSLPLAQAVLARYTDLDELFDLGPIDLHISGCMNSCGHHHTGHIGVLGVDKGGREWYQISLGGSDGSTLSGPAKPGKVMGPSFSAAEVPDVIEALLDTYRVYRNPGEPFLATVQRVGLTPFQGAANAVRTETREPEGHGHHSPQPADALAD
ncbi:MAG: nitrite/sulfite reductase [Rhodoferax sp.]